MRRSDSPGAARAIHRIAAIMLVLLVAGPPPSGAARQAAQSRDRGLEIGQAEEVAELPASGKRYALVIGIDKYEDSQVPPLTGAVNDAKAVVDAIVRYAGFPVEQVRLLASDQPRARQPTRGNILRQLSNLLAVVPEDGLLLISVMASTVTRTRMCCPRMGRSATTWR